MKQYLSLLRETLAEGETKVGRNGAKTTSVYGARMKFDLREGHPVVTTKKFAFKPCMAELCGLLRGVTHADVFRELGTKIWDANANLEPSWLANPYREGEDDLGPIYGAQWRAWPAYKSISVDNQELIDKVKKEGWSEITPPEIMYGGEDQTIFMKYIDQLEDCLCLIQNNPDSRRILFHAWNPAEIDQMALPPCHVLYQFHPNRESETMAMTVYMRSNDLGLGAPFNICSAATLLALFARLTGYTPTFLTMMIGDAHIYENQYDMVSEQIRREPYPLPKLIISDRIPSPTLDNPLSIEEMVGWLDTVSPEDFSLEGYTSHGPLTVPMVV